MGNIRSISNAFLRIGHAISVAEDPLALAEFDKLILPGVGAFGSAADQLEKNGLHASLIEFAKSGKPLLGLCLGMQLLLDSSEEAPGKRGLGLIRGTVRSFKGKVHDIPVTHTGWNAVEENGKSVLLDSIPKEKRDFYFVHGYFCTLQDRSAVKGLSAYGITFDVILEKENIFGCQFHPEKSQKSGLTLLKNFAGS